MHQQYLRYTKRRIDILQGNKAHEFKILRLPYYNIVINHVENTPISRDILIYSCVIVQ